MEILRSKQKLSGKHYGGTAAGRSTEPTDTGRCAEGPSIFAGWMDANGHWVSESGRLMTGRILRSGGETSTFQAKQRIIPGSTNGD
jgi:hypothetical protein